MGVRSIYWHVRYISIYLEFLSLLTTYKVVETCFMTCNRKNNGSSSSNEVRKARMPRCPYKKWLWIHYVYGSSCISNWVKIESHSWFVLRPKRDESYSFHSIFITSMYVMPVVGLLSKVRVFWSLVLYVLVLRLKLMEWTIRWMAKRSLWYSTYFLLQYFVLRCTDKERRV